MKMLYIKISLCFTYLLQKCMPTNHLNAYNNAPMGFPQRKRSLPLFILGARPSWPPSAGETPTFPGGSERLPLNAVGRNRRVPSFWQRLLLTVKTAYVPFFSPLGAPICIHVQRFF